MPWSLPAGWLTHSSSPARAAERPRRPRAHPRHGDAQRATRGVPAGQHDAVPVGQGEETAGKAAQPRLVGLRQGQVQRAGLGLRAAGREIAEVDGQGLVPQTDRVDRGQEMAAFDQGVRAHRPLLAGLNLQQGAVVSTAQCHAATLAVLGPPQDPLDQFEFTQGHRHRAPPTTGGLRSSGSPVRRPTSRPSCRTRGNGEPRPCAPRCSVHRR